MKTATPPKGVTARWVSRRITRSPESRAVISRGTSLSEMFASTPLYRKHLRAKYSSASEFRLSNNRLEGFRAQTEIRVGASGHAPPALSIWRRFQSAVTGFSVRLVARDADVHPTPRAYQYSQRQ